MGVQMIDVNHPSTKLEAWLVDTVHHHSQKAGIPMPEVGIYEGEANAFATGATKNSSMVAVSTGLLSSMNKEEVEAVLAHEIAHVANGDMVTMTLIQGVTNTFVVFLSRIIGNFVDRGILRNEDDAPGVGYYVTSFILDLVLGFPGFHGCGRFLPSSRIQSRCRCRKDHGQLDSDDQRPGSFGRCSRPKSFRGLSRVSVSPVLSASCSLRILPLKIVSQLCAHRTLIN